MVKYHTNMLFEINFPKFLSAEMIISYSLSAIAINASVVTANSFLQK
jgi:hypothetical protein